MSDSLTIKWNDQGLVPAIVQDSETGQVLMMAWMNAESLQLTQETGLAHFWSRSRQELWKKGATSGSLLHVQSITLDCDGDALLVHAHPDGPTCHTGEVTCFHRDIVAAPSEAIPGSVIDALFTTLTDRKINPTPGSYTNTLLEAGEEEILKKIGEESIEVILAAAKQGDERLISELADLVYHSLVLIVSRDLTPDDIAAELRSRMNK